MNLLSLDLNLLLVFEALCEERSVTRAATRCGLRQPAMSAALSRLRETFNDELFARSGGEMRPTPLALRLSPGVAAALAQLRTALALEVPFVPAEARQTFVVASTDYCAFVLLPRLMAVLAVEAPQVDLRIVGYDKDQIGPMLDRGEIDLAFGRFASPPERVVCRPLLEERFVGVVRDDHPALTPEGLSLEAFAGLPHALFSARRDATGAIDEALALHGLRRRVALTVPHMLVLPAVLAATDLVATLPERVARRLALPGLRLFPLPLDVPPWQAELLWNPTARSDRAHAWLRARLFAIGATV